MVTSDYTTCGMCAESIMNQFQFHSEQEHKAALYDACMLIVNTYNQTDVLDEFDPYGVTSYDFMKFARHILNQLST
jgi:hypothetical protein